MLRASRLVSSFVAVLSLLVVVFTSRTVSYADSNDEAQIRALEHRFSDAVQAKDIDKIMASYEHSPKLVVFDVIPPREYVGWDAYKKDWQEFLGTFQGPVKLDIQGLTVSAEGNLGYGFSFQHVTGKNKSGAAVDMTVRVTDVYRKSAGKWVIAHEHVSVPVDLDTAKADLQSKP